MKNTVKKNINTYFLWAILMSYLSINIACANDIIIPKMGNWKYLDDGSDLGAKWVGIDYDDSSWQTGNGKLGFGDQNNTTTLINHQIPISSGAATWYFRKVFTLNNPSQYDNLIYSLLRDDGAVVYLNGIEIGRSNMPVDTPIFLIHLPVLV
jgi:hypothetical protein